MTTNKLRELAKKAESEHWFEVGELQYFHVRYDDAAFIAATTPETILALLDENEALQTKNKELQTMLAELAVQGEPEYLISSCYFPNAGEVELSWERKDDGAKACLTAKVSPEQGEQIASVVRPGVYSTAVLQPAEHQLDLHLFAKRMDEELEKHDIHGFKPVILAVAEEVLGCAPIPVPRDRETQP